MTVAEADRIVNSLRILNYHCKDLTVLGRYLWQQENLENRKEKLSKKTINDLNNLTCIHYDGFCLWAYTDQSAEEIANTWYFFGSHAIWIGAGDIKRHKRNFSELENLRRDVKEDRRYLYLLKKIFLNYLIDHDEEGFRVEITGKTRTYAGKAILVRVNDRGFHLLSDERYESCKEGDDEKDYTQKIYSKINCYEFRQIKEAVHVIAGYLKARNIRVEIPSKWR